jgi:hypothetical protein
VSTPSDVRPRVGPRDIARKLIITLVIVGALVGLFYTGRWAVTGPDSTSGSLPDSVERLIPASGSEVLRQSQVGLDVADGFDAYLVVNGVEIRTAEDGLIKDLGTGLILFQPGPETPVEALNQGTNSVVAYVFDQTEGPTVAQPVSWRFEAT